MNISTAATEYTTIETVVRDLFPADDFGIMTSMVKSQIMIALAALDGDDLEEFNFRLRMVAHSIFGGAETQHQISRGRAHLLATACIFNARR